MESMQQIDAGRLFLYLYVLIPVCELCPTQQQFYFINYYLQLQDS